MKRLVVTGGDGFIGRHLVRKLLTSNSFEVVVISNTPNINESIMNDEHMVKGKLQENNPTMYYSADIRDRSTIGKIFSRVKPEACVHLAAKISVADSIKNPEETMSVNVNGTLNVLQACHENHVKNFAFASSAAVYGDVRELPIKETATLNPLSAYGTSKMKAEQHVESYVRQKKIQNAILFRIFNVYGYGKADESDVVTKFAKRLSNGLPPIIYGKGNFTRDFISVDDVTDAIDLSIRKMERTENNSNHVGLGTSPIFNVGTGIPTSINELAQKMIDIFGLKLSPEYEQGDDSQGTILHSYASTEMAKRAINFVAKTNLETGLRNMIERMQLSRAS